MDIEKFATKIDLAAMELRGYLLRLEKMSDEIQNYADKCERAAERSGDNEISGRKVNLWKEAFELLSEATSEFPQLIQSLHDVVSGVENAPTALNEIAQTNAAEAIAKHDARLAKRSAFNL